MAELPETLGDRIARLRRSLGWNQSELADRVSCRPNQISKFERGTYEPKLAV
jgi:transcriptional regulator with XRE-family HTH domain